MYHTDLRTQEKYIIYIMQRGKNSTQLFWLQRITVIVLLAIPLFHVGLPIALHWQSYTYPYYTENVYQALERVFGVSQYRQKQNPAIIPDETLFSYAAGAYIRGVDPILINSEHTPLGKYIIGISILLLKNDRFIVIPFALLSLLSLFLLAQKVLKNTLWSMLAVAIFSGERLFVDQLKVAPLLDLIQLPFVLLSLYWFLTEYPSSRFIGTSIMLGLVAATKSQIPAVLLVATFVLFFITQRTITKLPRFFLFLLLGIMVFIASYTQTFLHGHTFREFIGYQKWIILYQKSKLLYPFSVWRLIFLNQWQTWWGDMRAIPAKDWSITWPIWTSCTILTGLTGVFGKIKITKGILLLLLWALVYGSFLSMGVIYSRFLLQLFPVFIIITVFFIRTLIDCVTMDQVKSLFQKFKK